MYRVLQHQVGALAGNVHLCSLCSNQHFERSVNLCIVGFTFSRSAQGALPQTMAEHPAGAEVAAQLVEHFEPVRGNLTLKLIPGDGECQFRSIACQVPEYGYSGQRRLREDVVQHVALRADEYVQYLCHRKVYICHRKIYNFSF